ncbi:Protein MtfA [Pseudobythopirellula maris]|uniref:Protein MtfA n=1 Tax=Pseudobythopirellula maris TaxID=2527991 RepID=A0A5C5ZRT6_9BACT|nr:M90 family metallopeptidase [Pseudobythopirellula maris]TWT89805.1 Protein MtfA [Pseudobythopirellula maris]
MLPSWFKKRRRERVASAGLDEEWRDRAHQLCWQYPRLDPVEQRRLEELAAVFIAEKKWEGCGGFEVDDVVKQTIASQVALMTLGFDDEHFDSTMSVLVYPDAYVARDYLAVDDHSVLEFDTARLGEAWRRGPVVLSWPNVEAAGRGPNSGISLVHHEFAHQLDNLSDEANGLPPMPSHEAARSWLTTSRNARKRLSRELRSGVDAPLDEYATTNATEFFAVATEAFFQTPRLLKRWDGELFTQFVGFFRQDPMRWADR